MSKKNPFKSQIKKMTVLTAVLKVSNIFILQIAEGNAVPEKRCS